jgi:hypothetical protein
VVRICVIKRRTDVHNVSLIIDPAVIRSSGSIRISRQPPNIYTRCPLILPHPAFYGAHGKRPVRRMLLVLECSLRRILREAVVCGPSSSASRTPQYRHGCQRLAPRHVCTSSFQPYARLSQDNTTITSYGRGDAVSFPGGGPISRQTASVGGRWLLDIIVRSIEVPKMGYWAGEDLHLPRFHVS